MKKYLKLEMPANSKLNFGCGGNIKSEWINIDLNERADLTLDLRKALPFDDNSCTATYSEHFLEHLVYPEEASSFLNECFRVLKPGGLFSVGVPDTDSAIAQYLSHHCTGAGNDKRDYHPDWCTTPMEYLNCHFRNWDHKFAYDFETLEKLIRASGFVFIQRRSYSPELDSPDRKEGTLYVDALKPAAT